MRPKTTGAKIKYPYQPALGVKTDFEKLLQKFSSAGTVRYEKFAECWREMNMACFCAGRQTKRETREFVEQCFYIVTQFWLPPSSFLVRAGALYLLYGLYYYQLVLPKVKIRVTPEQWEMIKEFQEEARQQQHLDLDFVFQKLLLDKAFIFVATPEEVNLKQRGTDDNQVIPESMKDETSMLDELFSSSALNQLSLVHDQYQKMKLAIQGDDSTEPDTSLNIVHSDLITSIYKTIQTHKDRQRGLKSQVKDKNLDDTEEAELLKSSSLSVKGQLKQKAFQQSTSWYRETSGNIKDELQTSEEPAKNEAKAWTLKHHPRRKKKTYLYDKDEGESAPVEIPLVHEIHCMPDLEAIAPTPTPTKGSKSSDADIRDDIEEEKEGLPDTSKKDDTDNTETDVEEKSKDTDKESNLGNKDAVGKTEETENLQTQSGQKNNKSNEKTTENKKRQGPQSDKDSVKELNVNMSDCKKAKTVPAVKSTKRRVSVKDTPVDDTPELKADTEKVKAKEEVEEKRKTKEEEENKLTAQQILQMKLTKRKKEARLKSSRQDKKGKQNNK